MTMSCSKRAARSKQFFSVTGKPCQHFQCKTMIYQCKKCVSGIENPGSHENTNTLINSGTQYAVIANQMSPYGSSKEEQKAQKGDV